MAILVGLFFFLLIIGFIVLGVFLFRRGFILYAKYKLFQDIPFSKIGSLAMGIVKVRGRVRYVKNSSKLQTPFSKTDCVYYECRVYRQKRSFNKSLQKYSQDEIFRSTKSIPFIIEDISGSILVHPEKAIFGCDASYTGGKATMNGIPTISTNLNQLLYKEEDMQKMAGDSLVDLTNINDFDHTKYTLFFEESYLTFDDVALVVGTATTKNGIFELVKGLNDDSLLISNTNSNKFKKLLLFRAYLFWITGIFAIVLDLGLLLIPIFG